MDMMSETFADHAQTLTRGQLLDVLLDIEGRLKLLIRAVFQGKNHEDWTRLIPSVIREELKSGPSSAADAKGTEADLLDRASLNQLIDILLSRWGHFQPILNDKAWLQSRLGEMREVRNALVHGYQPNADYKVKVAILLEEIGNRIPLGASSDGVMPKQSTTLALVGHSILWVDDLPENNYWPRRLFTDFGADVVPVLSNDEAIDEAKSRHFDVVVSDIDRGGGEPGSKLGMRLKMIGVHVPIVFFVSFVDPSKPIPYAGVTITNDVVSMLTSVFSILRPDAVVSQG